MEIRRLCLPKTRGKSAGSFVLPKVRVSLMCVCCRELFSCVGSAAAPGKSFYCPSTPHTLNTNNKASQKNNKQPYTVLSRNREEGEGKCSVE